MEFLIVMAGLFAVMWLVLIRPQRRRQVQQAEMLANLEVGDEILTAGGLYGEIQSVEEDEVRLEIAPGTSVRVAKRAVAAVLSDEEEDEEAEDEVADGLQPPERDAPAEADPSASRPS